MKRNIALFAVALLVSITLNAQPAKRFWSEGPLRWNDFRSVTTAEQEKSHLEYVFGFYPENKTIDGIRYKYYKVDAYMVPRLSWAIEFFMDSKTLRYNQIVFDIIEISRRRLQQQFHQSCVSNNYSRMFDDECAHLSEYLKEFRKATNDGEDSAAMAYYETQVQQLLSVLPANEIPNYSLLPINLGTHIGLGTAINTGGLSSIFPTDGVMFNWGLTIGWNQHAVIIDASFGKSATHKNITINHQPFSDSDKLRNYHCCILYGYKVLENNKYSIRPLIGIGGNGYEYRDIVNKVQVGAECASPYAGIFIERHFFKEYEVLPCIFLFDQSRMRSEFDCFSIYGKLLFSYSSFSDIQPRSRGLNISLQIGLSLGTTPAKHL